MDGILRRAVEKSDRYAGELVVPEPHDEDRLHLPI